MTSLVLAASLVSLFTMMQQEVFNNPRQVSFICPDHDRDTGHEVDILSLDGKVIQTLQVGDPVGDANNLVIVDLNVQPVAFGEYRFVVRAVAGALKSDPSEPSVIWFRVPGAPGKPSPR